MSAEKTDTPYVLHVCLQKVSRGKSNLIAHFHFSECEQNLKGALVKFGFNEIKICCKSTRDFLLPENLVSHSDLDLSELTFGQEASGTLEDSIQVKVKTPSLTVGSKSSRTSKVSRTKRNRVIAVSGKPNCMYWTFSAIHDEEGAILEYSFTNRNLGIVKSSKSYPIQWNVELKKRDFVLREYSSNNFWTLITKKRFMLRSFVYKELFGKWNNRVLEQGNIHACEDRT